MSSSRVSITARSTAPATDTLCRRLKPGRNFQACTCGTTEVVPCYKASRRRGQGLAPFETWESRIDTRSGCFQLEQPNERRKAEAVVEDHNLHALLSHLPGSRTGRRPGSPVPCARCSLVPPVKGLGGCCCRLPSLERLGYLTAVPAGLGPLRTSVRSLAPKCDSLCVVNRLAGYFVIFRNCSTWNNL